MTRIARRTTRPKRSEGQLLIRIALERAVTTTARLLKAQRTEEADPVMSHSTMSTVATRDAFPMKRLRSRAAATSEKNPSHRANCSSLRIPTLDLVRRTRLNPFPKVARIQTSHVLAMTAWVTVFYLRRAADLSRHPYLTMQRAADTPSFQPIFLPSSYPRPA